MTSVLFIAQISLPQHVLFCSAAWTSPPVCPAEPICPQSSSFNCSHEPELIDHGNCAFEISATLAREKGKTGLTGLDRPGKPEFF
jgi:hypothetical protein